MKKGKLLLNWQKDPVGVYLGHNKVFYIKSQSQSYLNNKQMRALFYQESGLEGANLTETYLCGADLTGADLTGADLTGADLYRAKLSCANLYRTNLEHADLSCANLSDANLIGANLSHANLSYADLRGVDLRGVKYNKSTIWPVGFDISKLFY
jgi:uncharacterized protein YjbI with pentapeptide repeats